MLEQKHNVLVAGEDDAPRACMAARYGAVSNMTSMPLTSVRLRATVA